LLYLFLMAWLKLNRQKVLALILLLATFIFTHRFFFLPGDFSTHDGVHFIRLYDLEKVLREGQFPPRWLPDLGKGYGYPFFNFYPPLSYFTGLVFRFLGTSFTLANRLSFAAAGLVGGVGMFYFGRLLFGFWGGAIAALFWLFLPYRAVDLYVRGSLAEYWGMNLLPWTFYLAKKLFDYQTLKRFLLFTFSLFLLLVAHNAVSLISSIWLVVFIIFLLVVNRDWSGKSFRQKSLLAVSFLLALGLAAFFIFPAVLEKDFTHIVDMTSDYYAYYNHFPSLGQLFISRFWGYGGSNFGLNDEMSFQIGHLHWLLALLALVLLARDLLANRRLFFSKGESSLLVTFFVISFLGISFLAHQRSFFIWKLLPFLGFLQFPWRLLVFIGFSVSLLAGFGVSRLVGKKGFLVSTALFLVLVGLNFNYFKPEAVVDINDQDYLFSPLWEYQQREFLTDYLPKSVKIIPQDYYHPPLVVGGEETEIKLDQADKVIFLTSLGEDKEIVIKRFYFPGWQAKINRKPVEIKSDQNGFMVLPLPEGRSLVEISFEDTLVRKIANWISLCSWGLFLGLAIIIGYRQTFVKKRHD
jgi:hypothetical protein